MDRIVPARFFSDKILNLANTEIFKEISQTKVNEIQDYISYILEENIELKKLAEHQDKDIYKYSNTTNQYTSYNATSGEDVLTRILIDSVEAEKKSLILIDEIELGLHPKVQARLIDVLYSISKKDHKQFIITTHSATILSSLNERSRIFIEKKHDGNFKAIKNISVNAALTKMDANSYPLLDVYCEDNISKQIIQKALILITKEKNIVNFEKLINIVVSGSADKTYDNFKAHQRTYKDRKIICGFACVLDGDQRNKKKNKEEEYLHFLYSNDSPERFLCKAFLINNLNAKIEYHLEKADSHCLFDKIIENTDLTTKEDVFDACWKAFIQTKNGQAYIDTLKIFLFYTAKTFSKDL